MQDENIIQLLGPFERDPWESIQEAIKAIMPFGRIVKVKIINPGTVVKWDDDVMECDVYVDGNPA